MAHPEASEPLDPAPVVLVGADLGIEARRIDDVVAVIAAGDRLQIRRGVTIADAERVIFIVSLNREILGSPDHTAASA
jgi:hypothetical protein